MKHPGIRLRVLVDGAEVINATSADLHYIAKYSGYHQSTEILQMAQPAISLSGSFAMPPQIEIYIEAVEIEIDDPAESYARRFVRSAKRAHYRKQPFRFGE